MLRAPSSPWLVALVGVLGGAAGFVIVAVISILLLLFACSFCWAHFTGAFPHF